MNLHTTKATLQCQSCCIKAGYGVSTDFCGDDMDCDPSLEWGIYLFVGLMAFFFTTLMLACCVCRYCQGKEARRKLIEQVLWRYHQVTNLDTISAVSPLKTLFLQISIGIAVPKNIPLREATISRGLDTEPAATDDIKELIGIEMAPL